MIHRIVTFAGLWALIAVPALCTAGVLAHSCVCAAESACEHEVACDVDPCGESALRQAESRRDTGELPATIVPVLLSDAIAETMCNTEPAPVVLVPPPPRAPDRPGDLPLRL